MMVYFTAAQLASVSIPARLKCWQCEKWKRNELFSNKQHKEYQTCILRGGNTNGLKIKCADCATDQRVDLECEGPCGKTKDISKFSKNSRKAGGNHWCLECTSWKLSYETDIQVGPAPEETLAPDECYGSTLAIEGLYDEDDYAIEDGDSTAPAGYETGNKNPWYKKTNEKSEVPTGFENASEITGRMGGLRLESEHPYQPPHLRGMDYRGPLNKPTSTVPRPGNTASFHTRSVTTASNPYESEPDEEWRAVGPRARPLAFNGYDNTGQRHLQHKYPGSGSGSTYSTTKAPTKNDQAKRVPGPAVVTRNPGPSISSAEPKYQFGLEGNDPDSDDDHYYD